MSEMNTLDQEKLLKRKAQLETLIEKLDESILMRVQDGGQTTTNLGSASFSYLSLDELKTTREEYVNELAGIEAKLDGRQRPNVVKFHIQM